MKEDPRRLLARAESESAAVAERLRDATTALLDANQRLAQVPLLEHRMEGLRRENVWLVEERRGLEAEIARLREEVASLRARIETIEGSRSWRLLAPLRRLRQALRG
jgi:predicted nuclease with TOPRIM domain